MPELTIDKAIGIEVLRIVPVAFVSMHHRSGDHDADARRYHDIVYMRPSSCF